MSGELRITVDGDEITLFVRGVVVWRGTSGEWSKALAIATVVKPVPSITEQKGNVGSDNGSGPEAA